MCRFRWVQCQLDYLKLLRTDLERRAALSNLPPGLHESYKQLLDRMTRLPSELGMAQKAFIWLLFCPDRLTSTDILMALAIDPIQGYNPDARLDSEGDLLEICGPLIRCSRPGGIVEFVHFSVAQYLKSPVMPNGDPNPYFIEEIRGRQLISESCRSTYRSKEELGRFGAYICYLWDYLAWSLAERGYSSYTQRMMMMRYSPYIGTVRSDALPEASNLQSSLYSFSTETPPEWEGNYERDVFKLWHDSFDNSWGGILSQKAIDHALWLSIKQNGEIGEIREILYAKRFRLGYDTFDSASFQLAVKMGRGDVIDLIQNEFWQYPPPGSWVVPSSGMQPDFSQQPAGVSVNETTDENLVRILLNSKEWESNPDLPPPIIAAASLGRLSVLEQVLASDEDVRRLGSQMWKGTTALHLASFHPNPNAVELLLKARMDPNSQNHMQYTPLHIAVIMGHERTVRILLPITDLSILDVNGLTSLHHAARLGRKRIVEMLVAGGAAQIPSQFGTPSDLALREGHLDIAGFLNGR